MRTPTDIVTTLRISPRKRWHLALKRMRLTFAERRALQRLMTYSRYRMIGDRRLTPDEVHALEEV